MISVKDWQKAAEYLKEASKLLKEGESFTDIQRMAAYRRGLKTITRE